MRELVNEGRIIFAPLYELRPAQESNAAPAPMPSDARLRMRRRCRRVSSRRITPRDHPKSNTADVRPLPMDVAEIDALLTQIEVWNLRR